MAYAYNSIRQEYCQEFKTKLHSETLSKKKKSMSVKSLFGLKAEFDKCSFILAIPALLPHLGLKHVIFLPQFPE